MQPTSRDPAVVLDAFAAGLEEELGWRGFALPPLQARQPDFAASLLLGVLWGLWHLLINIAMGYTPLGFTSYAQAFPFPLSALLTWVYNNTRGSLFLMILFHAVSDSAPFTILATRNT